MNKYISAILGVILGGVISLVLISTDSLVVFGEEGQEEDDLEVVNPLEEATAYGDLFDWRDIFSPSNSAQGLYYLVYDKVMNSPRNDALKDVAQKYGITLEEANAVIKGDVGPLLSSPQQRSAEITIETAYVLAENMQEDFAFTQELFQLEKDIEVAINPGEMFANGDLMDSGFDLVHDLSIIEEILFLERSENTVGHPYADQMDSPYSPLLSAEEQTEYLAPGEPGPIYELSFKHSALEYQDDDSANLLIGDEEIPVDVLDKDVCESDAPLDGAIDAYEEENAPEPISEDEGDEDEVDAEDDAGEDGGANLPTEEDDEGGIEPAPADEWLKAWCPGLEASGSSGTASSSTFGEKGFSSIGDTVGSLLGQAAGSAAYYGNDAFSAHLAICFEVETVMESVSSYQPGESCILCEVEQINELMDRTLSHSITPNKATGNLFESAKCKEAYGSLLDMQIITIEAPVQTPPNDDVIYGRNVIDEWNKFVNRYIPYVKVERDKKTEYVTDYAPDDLSYETTYLQVEAEINRQTAAALRDIESTRDSSDAVNIAEYLQIILTEMRATNGYFGKYKDRFNEILNVCNSIKSKPQK